MPAHFRLPIQFNPRTPALASSRLNKTIMKLAAAADTHRFLAAPATGSAISATFLDRLIGLNDFGSGRPSDIDIARQAFDTLDAEGQVLRLDGQPIKRTDIQIEAIAKLVTDFREQRLPRWRALGII